MKASVHVTLKPGVLDVQGKAIERELKELGLIACEGVRVGKVIEISLNNETAGGKEQVKGQIEELCSKFLANTVIEKYQVTISEE